MPSAATPSPLLLDACSLLNLYASRQLPTILRAYPARFVLAEVVQREALYVARGGTGEDARELERVDLAPTIAAGLLNIVAATGDELLTYIDLLAERLGDGEAATIAIARHRGWSVVTDDRRARRLAMERGVALLWTLDLLKHWCDSQAVPFEVMRAALTDIRERASYLPARSHPLKGWWDAFMPGVAGP